MRRLWGGMAAWSTVVFRLLINSKRNLNHRDAKSLKTLIAFPVIYVNCVNSINYVIYSNSNCLVVTTIVSNCIAVFFIDL